jgi:UDPglucose 6-dehydrogenase
VNGVDAGILNAVEDLNADQKRLPLDRIVEIFGEDLSGRTFTVWGLSFKPETDDMREAPAIVVIDGLLARGARVRAHDPEAMDVARGIYGDRVEFFEDNYVATHDADALVIMTEWRPYRRPDFDKLSLLKRKLVIDGRNLFDPERMRELGFEYISIGRPAVNVASAREALLA